MIRRLCATILLVALAGPAGASDWGYDGAHGPDHWAEISGDNALCATGAFQSPFNIVPDIAADLPDLDIHYGQVPVAVTNTVTRSWCRAGRRIAFVSKTPTGP